MAFGGQLFGAENSIVRKQLKVKLGLGDLNKVEEGVVNSGSSCNLALMSHCLRHDIGYQTGNRVREILSFNGSRREITRQVKLLMRIGPWIRKYTVLVTS